MLKGMILPQQNQAQQNRVYIAKDTPHLTFI